MGLAPPTTPFAEQSFDRIMRNIQESAHGSLFINYTVNSRNKDDVARVL